MYSGQAQTINCTATAAAARVAQGCYALLVGDPYAGAHNVDQFYNPAAFSGSGAGGDDRPDRLLPARRSAQPGHRSADAADRLGLRAPVQGQWGQKNFEFRVEIFNLTNTAAFNLPANAVLNFNDPRNFASMTTMRNRPRQVQLGAKFYW